MICDVFVFGEKILYLEFVKPKYIFNTIIKTKYITSLKLHYKFITYAVLPGIVVAVVHAALSLLLLLLLLLHHQHLLPRMTMQPRGTALTPAGLQVQVEQQH